MDNNNKSVSDEISLPIGLVKVNCKTCKGEKEIKNKNFLKEVEDENNLGYMIICPDCEGKGHYLVKNL